LTGYSSLGALTWWGPGEYVTLEKTFYNRLFKQKIQDAAERTPRFGRVIASGAERVQWWGARRQTAVYVPFSVYPMVRLGEHRTFIVEEFIKMAGRW